MRIQIPCLICDTEAPSTALRAVALPRSAALRGGGSSYTRSSICRDNMAANSSANPSRRCACLFTSDVNLL
jgi:hypothetical protein